MAIKILFLDVDGTLTDGKIYMGENGEICKAFNIKDGYGIHDILIPAGIIPVVITGRRSRILENRCAEIGITEIYQGINNKLSKMMEVLEKHHIPISQSAYIGDDLNDFECMKAIKEANGSIGCPANSVNAIREYSDFVANSCGGEGAVREYICYIIKQNEENNET